MIYKVLQMLIYLVFMTPVIVIKTWYNNSWK